MNTFVNNILYLFVQDIVSCVSRDNFTCIVLIFPAHGPACSEKVTVKTKTKHALYMVRDPRENIKQQ